MKTTKEKEHYIKEIYKLIENNKKVSVSSLSFTLGVSKSSVTNMLKKLVKMQLVDTAPYKPITLTIDGKKRCADVKTIHGRETREKRKKRSTKFKEMKLYFRKISS